MQRKFNNTTEFVKALTQRVDNNKDTIVALGVQSPTDCDGRKLENIGDNHIRGFFYRADKGYYDSFIIKTNFHRSKYADNNIKQIRNVTTALGYYH